MERIFGINGNFIYWEQANINALSAHLAISNTNDEILDSLTYNGYGTWPTGAAGTGKSIILCDLQSDNGLGSNWILDQNTADLAGDYIYGAQTAQLFASPGRVNCRTTGAQDPRVAESKIYPNPFNSITHLSYYLPEASMVTLRIINLLGKDIIHLVNERMMPGIHTVEWDPANLPSGVYYYRLAFGENILWGKMVFLK